LKELHLQVDLMPDEALASEVASAFARFESIENLKICLLRAEVANQELPEPFKIWGLLWMTSPSIGRFPNGRSDRRFRHPAGAGSGLADVSPARPTWRIFTRASTCRNLLKKFPGMRVASSVRKLSKALNAVGVTPASKPNSIPSTVLSRRCSLKEPKRRPGGPTHVTERRRPRRQHLKISPPA
jgi:hypothetical protein